MLLVLRAYLQNAGSQCVRLRLFVDAIRGISAACVLCLGCGDSESGITSDWNGAQAVHVVRSDRPQRDPDLRIFAVRDGSDVCSLFDKAQDRELLGVDYLGSTCRTCMPARMSCRG